MRTFDAKRQTLPAPSEIAHIANMGLYLRWVGIFVDNIDRHENRVATRRLSSREASHGY